MPPPSPLAVSIMYIHIIIIPTRAEFGLVPTRSGGGGIWPASSLPATGPKPSFRSLSEENFLYIYINICTNDRCSSFPTTPPAPISLLVYTSARGVWPIEKPGAEIFLRYPRNRYIIIDLTHRILCIVFLVLYPRSRAGRRHHSVSAVCFRNAIHLQRPLWKAEYCTIQYLIVHIIIITQKRICSWVARNAKLVSENITGIYYTAG